MPKLSAVLVRALPVLAFFLLAGPAGAAPLVTLDGTLHERDLRPDLFPDDPAGSFLPALLPSGRFSFYGDTDLRTDPQAAVLETDAGGWLVALAPASVRLLAPPRRDPESGRTLRPDAPEGAVCATGDEPDCWRPGDPPLGVEDVVDALCAAVGAEAVDSGLVDSEPEPVGCRFRENLGIAPFDFVAFLDRAVVQPTQGQGEGQGPLPLVPLNTDDPGAAFLNDLTVQPAHAPLPGVDLLNIDTSVLAAVLTGIPILPFPTLMSPPAFPSELAAVSFNFQMLLVALSPGDGSPAGAPETFDPDDAFSMSAGQCSFLQPQFCSSVQALFTTQDARLQTLPDDPSGTPHERWIWEAGAELEITAAGGALGRFAGGKLLALGPERARVGNPATDVGVTFVLVPDDPAETPQLFFAAPEPEGAALAGAALATLVALSQRRRAHR